MTENEENILKMTVKIKEYCENKLCIDCIFFKYDKICGMKYCVIERPTDWDLSEANNA